MSSPAWRSPSREVSSPCAPPRPSRARSRWARSPVDVVPARSGEVDVYVPVVDWGVRAEPYTAPVAVELEFRSLESRCGSRRASLGRERRREPRGARGRAARCGLGRPQASGSARRSSAAQSAASSAERSSRSSTAVAGSCSGRPPDSRPRGGRQPVRLRRPARADVLRPRRGVAAAAPVLGARAGRRWGLRRLLRRRS